MPSSIHVIPSGEIWTWPVSAASAPSTASTLTKKIASSAHPASYGSVAKAPENVPNRSRTAV